MKTIKINCQYLPTLSFKTLHELIQQHLVADLTGELSWCFAVLPARKQ